MSLSVSQAPEFGFGAEPGTNFSMFDLGGNGVQVQQTAMIVYGDVNAGQIRFCGNTIRQDVIKKGVVGCDLYQLFAALTSEFEADTHMLLLGIVQQLDSTKLAAFLIAVSSIISVFPGYFIQMENICNDFF